MFGPEATKLLSRALRVAESISIKLGDPVARFGVPASFIAADPVRLFSLVEHPTEHRDRALRAAEARLQVSEAPQSIVPIDPVRVGEELGQARVATARLLQAAGIFQTASRRVARVLLELRARLCLQQTIEIAEAVAARRIDVEEPKLERAWSNATRRMAAQELVQTTLRALGSTAVEVDERAVEQR